MIRFTFMLLCLWSHAVLAQEQVAQKRVSQKPKALKGASEKASQSVNQDHCAAISLEEVTTNIIKQNREHLNFKIFMINKTYDDVSDTKLGKRVAMLQLIGGDVNQTQALQNECLIAYRIRRLEADHAQNQEPIMDIKLIGKLQVKQVEGQVIEAQIVYDDIIYTAASKKAIQESVKKVVMEGDFVTSFKQSPTIPKEVNQSQTSTRPRNSKGSKASQEPKVIDYSEIPQDQYRWKM